MKTKLALLTLSLLALVAGASLATAQGTALTYQGRLDTTIGPATGTYDFQFTVRDALTAGSPVGVNPLAATLAVNNGLFTVTLDPGAGVFTGAERWLEIAVRTNGATSFVTLSPRQPLTATPYAITAGAVSGSVPASQLTGTIPLAQLPVAVVTNGTTGVNISGAFSGNGAGLTTLPPNVALRDAVQTFSGENTFDQSVNINGRLNLRSELTLAQPVPGLEGGELMLLDAGVLAPVGNTSWIIDNFGAVSNASLRFHRNGIVGLSLAETSLSYGGALYADLATRQVGIGSTAPKGKLEIQSGANADGAGDQVAIALGWHQGGYRHFIRTRHNSAGVADNAIDFFVNTAATPEASSAPGINNQLVMSLNGGNVGIGTTAPTAKLHVNGGVVAGSFSGDGAGLTGLAAANISGTLADGRLSANVATLTANQTFAGVNAFSQAVTVGFLAVNPQIPGGNEGGEILLRGAGGSSNPDWSIDNNSGQVRFFTGSGVKFAVNSVGDATFAGRISAAGSISASAATIPNLIGNVSLFGDLSAYGNVSVNSNVTANGSVTANGNITANGNVTANGEMTARVVTITGGSDVAEPYHVAAAGDIKPVPGMVVVIDSEQIGQMRVAARAYDKTVAGILSGANGISPGITLRQTGTVADGALPVASIGRVWCYCDADANGPIEAGDMLTTSDTAGHAMKVGDFDRADGSVIGKAMSPLKSGRGLVLVLVSLK